MNTRRRRSNAERTSASSQLTKMFAWSDNPVKVREFVDQRVLPVPTIARIDIGRDLKSNSVESNATDLQSGSVSALEFKSAWNTTKFIMKLACFHVCISASTETKNGDTKCTLAVWHCRFQYWTRLSNPRVILLYNRLNKLFFSSSGIAYNKRRKLVSLGYNPNEISWITGHMLKFP